MIVFIDSSVVLRRLFSESHSLKQSKRWAKTFASRLLFVEANRVIDRNRLLGSLNDSIVVDLHVQIKRFAELVTTIELNNDILSRAAESFPTVIGTLDAIHLSTALSLRKELNADVVFATHDQQLARAARATHFPVIGAT